MDRPFNTERLPPLRHVLLGMSAGGLASVVWALAFVSFGLLVFLGRDV